MKLLIGGSPCTFWTIANMRGRETEPSGLGWELFKNYLIAKEKFKPDYFLYENNVSANSSIKRTIKEVLNVYDESNLFLVNNRGSGVRYVEIDSALVSCQHRKRFYVATLGDNYTPPKTCIYPLKKTLKISGNY